MSSISPSEEQPGSKAKKSWKSLYDERMASLPTVGLTSSNDYPEIAHPDVNFTPCPRNDMSRKASSASPTRPMSDGITMGASSTFDRLMTSMSKQKCGASSSTRLQPQLTSSTLGLTPSFGATGDISDMFAGVMNGLDELRRDMTKRIDQVDERAHKGQENLRDELTHVKSQARVDQAQLIRNTDQCLAESLAQANKESYEREARMTREIERLLNDHDSTYAHTMTSLEKRLDAKSDLMMRKLDAILNGSNWQEHSNPRVRSRHANDGDGTGSNARAQQSSRTNYEPRNKERDSARKIFDILLNRFGSGVQGHQAMVKFEKRRQRDDESIDKFLDDLELLRRRSNPDERISERNLAIASKFMDGVRSEELKTMLATHFTLSLDQVPTPDDLRMK